MIEKLVDCLRALAAPADIQVARFPDFVCKAGELALDYADALLLAFQCQQLQFTQEQRQALQRVDDLLDGMSGEQNAHIWTDAALGSAPEWVAVRDAAMAAVHALGMRYEPPGRDVRVTPRHP